MEEEEVDEEKEIDIWRGRSHCHCSQRKMLQRQELAAGGGRRCCCCCYSPMVMKSAAVHQGYAVVVGEKETAFRAWVPACAGGFGEGGCGVCVCVWRMGWGLRLRPSGLIKPEDKSA